MTPEELSTVAINMIMISEAFNEDMTGSLSEYLSAEKLIEVRNNVSVFTKEIFETDEMKIITSKGINQAEALIQSVTKLIDLKNKFYTEGTAQDKEAQSKNIQDMTYLIEKTISEIAKTLPPGKEVQIDNDFVTTSILKENYNDIVSNTPSFAKSGKSYSIEDDLKVTIPANVIKNISTSGSIKTKVVKWKTNPYANLTETAKLINSSIVSFSFVDENGNEIKIADSKQYVADIDIPILKTDKTGFIHYCVYFDPNAKTLVKGIVIL